MATSVYTVSYRMEVVNASLQGLGTINPDLKDSAPTITNNVNRTIKRSLDGMRLLPADFAAVDPLTEFIRVWGTINGVEKPLGVFMWTDASGARRTYGVVGNATMVDFNGFLDQPVGRPLGYAVGTSIDATLYSLAAEVGVQVFNLAVTGKAMTAAANYTASTSRASVMAEIAGMAGLYSPFFNNAGALTTIAPAALTDSVLAYSEGDNIIDGTIVETNDLLSAPNRYVVEATGANDSPVWAAYDLPPEAVNSYSRRGFYIVHNEQAGQGVTTADECYVIAKAAALADDSTYMWAEFDSIPSHDHDTFDVVKYLGVPYREQEYKLELKAGSVMHHSLRRHYA